VKTHSLRKSLKNNHLGVIDCGGSKISLAIFDIGKTPAQFLTNYTVATQRGKKPLVSQLCTMIKHHVLSHSTLSWVIGFPGKIIDGVIQEGSANNLSPIPGEFDNYPISKAILDNVAETISIRVINDALLQTQGIIYECSPDIIAQLSDTPFMYIGPGTGLGGALAKVTNTNTRKLSYIGDGHIYDIMLTINNKEVMAEDLISGRALFEITGVTGKKANEDTKLIQKIKPTLTAIGIGLAQLVIQIKNGKMTKKYPFNKWPLTVQEHAQTVEYFFLGGGLVQHHIVGNVIYNSMIQTIDEFKKKECQKVTIVRPRLNTLSILKGGLLELFD
jgi:glucokinase